MIFSCTGKTRHKLLSAVLVGMLLRSLVAAGFMLDTQPANGSWLSVKICPGPGGINAIPGLSAKHAHHHHQPSTGEHKHDHAAQDHAFSTCGHWSASGLGISSDVVGPLVAVLVSSVIAIAYRDVLRAYTLPRVGKAREPPVLS